MQVERVIGVGVKIWTPSTGFSPPLSSVRRYAASSLASFSPLPGWATMK